MPTDRRKLMTNRAPIVLAVDTSDLATAISWVKATEDVVSVYKLGLEFYLTFGSEGVNAIKQTTNSDIFLDLKLHDIENTVSGAARAVSSLRPKYLTVHASGGAGMIHAAVDALPSTLVTAVTVLTSLSESDVESIGFRDSALDSAVRLASLATNAGARAIVCSPLEILAIRQAVGSAVTIITPGVRPVDTAHSDDQKRTMTPREAIDCGADFVVIGRPITMHWQHGAQAMRERAMEIAQQINSVH